MLSAREKDEQAKAMVSAFVDRSLVLLTDTPVGVRSKHPASGVLLRTPGGHAVVLTAAHALPECPPINVCMNAGFFFDAVEGVAQHPVRDVDVAVALLRPDAASQLLPFAHTFDQVESSPDHRVERDAPLVAGGFPDQFTTDALVSESLVEHRFTAIVRFTKRHGHDRRRLSLDWTAGYPIDRGRSPAHAAFDVERGRPFHLKKPRGLSGGPIYRITPGPFESFDPSSHCKLIAVAVEYVNRRELAVPWWSWLAWLRMAP